MPEDQSQQTGPMPAWAVGDTIRVPEDAYRFGTGVLTLYVAEVISRGPFQGAEWAELRGHEVNPDGTLRVRQRYAFVRVDRATIVRVPSL
ncbi:hypothetical protein ACVCAH_05000 [Micromonospora sp. LZ34]